MRNFLIKRLLLSVVILFFVCFIIYGLMRCLPSSYVEQMAMTLSNQPGAKSYTEWLDQLNAQYGMDKSPILGFLDWASNAIRGDFGDSWMYSVDVVSKF